MADSMAGVDDYAKALTDYGEVLTRAVIGALPGWVDASVRRVAAAAGAAVDEDDLAEAGRQAAVETGTRLRALLSADIDDQRGTPLSIVRDAVRWPGAVLRAAGVPPVARDDFDTERFPGDAYGLTPATFADLDPDLADVAIAWGAAKAWEHRRRHMPGA
jgi:broad specificity phosphatase PhoE